MGTGKGGKHELARIRHARADGHAGELFVAFAHAVDVRKIKSGIDALRIHIEGNVYDVEVSRALAVSEKRAFNSVCSRKQAEFARSDGFPAVVVIVQTDDDVFAVRYVFAKIFDLIGKDVRRRAFDRRRQIQNNFIARRFRPRFFYRFADFDRVFDFGRRKTFRRIFEADMRVACVRKTVLHALDAVEGKLRNLRLCHAERIFSLRGRRRIVDVENRFRRTFQRCEGFFDKVFTRLAEHLQRYVFGHAVFFDKPA